MSDEILDLLTDAVMARVSARLSHEPPPAAPSAELPALPESCDTATAATFLGLSRQFLKQMRLKGNGPPFVKVGATVRYSKDALVAFRARRTRRNTSQQPKAPA
jgi:hypothetical protein